MTCKHFINPRLQNRIGSPLTGRVSSSCNSLPFTSAKRSLQQNAHANAEAVVSCPANSSVSS
ncbi:MAG TPA: hypothetical protein V6D09_09145 [Leptolyngbyaceae cyanobacterium]